MKLSVLAAPILLIACTFQGQSLQPELNSLKESWETWKSLKAKNGGNYSYSARFNSVFGFWEEYKYTVRNDSMETISITTGRFDSTGTATSILKYFDTLSSSEKSWYKTIDGQYQFCQDSVLTLSQSKNDISDLQFLGNGVLKSCTYSPHGCEDDCTTGPRIDTVMF
jgi:hypothetical protein